MIKLSCCSGGGNENAVGKQHDMKGEGDGGGGSVHLFGDGCFDETH
jgi:hypothetical protein